MKGTCIVLLGSGYDQVLPIALLLTRGTVYLHLRDFVIILVMTMTIIIIATLQVRIICSSLYYRPLPFRMRQDKQEVYEVIMNKV